MELVFVVVRLRKNCVDKVGSEPTQDHSSQLLIQNDSFPRFEVALINKKVVASVQLENNCCVALAANQDPLSSSDEDRETPLGQTLKSTIKELPKFSLDRSERLSNPKTLVLRHYQKLFRDSKQRRVLPITLQWDKTSQGLRHHGNELPTFSSSNKAFSVVLPQDSDEPPSIDSRIRFYALDQVASLCQKSSLAFDPESGHILVYLERWLLERHRTSKRFVTELFAHYDPLSRIAACCHNPAYLAESKDCTKVKQDRESLGTIGSYSNEMRPDVLRAHRAHAQMVARDKCNVFLINPLFGTHLPYRVENAQKLVLYFAKDRPKLPPLKQSSSIAQSESSDSSSTWMDDYPLHKCAFMNNFEKLKALLEQGANPNQPDRDGWAPLHYAAWYGNLKAVEILLTFGNCDINILNRNLSTPLHFAAWCGHHYVVELFLSHPDLKLDSKDKDGKTPLSLCECVPKPEWQVLAELIMNAQKQKLPKIQVDFEDRSNMMVLLSNGLDTTAAQLHSEICRELKLPEEIGHVFALWIRSESLQLQLKGEHKPLQHFEMWQSKILAKYSQNPEHGTETPRLVFKRDAKLTLKEERRMKLDEGAITLLFHEAHRNYISGLYPCKDKDAILLAATVFQILHGNYQERHDKKELSNENTLTKLLPQHKLRCKNVKWPQRIMEEHKLVTSQGANNILGLQNQFLSFCRSLRVYGSAFFDAVVFMRKPIKGALQVHVGINDFGLHLINAETKAMFQSYAHNQLEYKLASDRPYLEFKVNITPMNSHAFTLNSRQASLINVLLVKFSSSHNQ